MRNGYKKEKSPIFDRKGGSINGKGRLCSLCSQGGWAKGKRLKFTDGGRRGHLVSHMGFGKVPIEKTTTKGKLGTFPPKKRVAWMINAQLYVNGKKIRKYIKLCEKRV